MFAELGDVVNGAKPALREKTTVFKSLGRSLKERDKAVCEGCPAHVCSGLQGWELRMPCPLSWCLNSGKPKLANAEGSVFNKVHSQKTFNDFICLKKTI